MATYPGGVFAPATINTGDVIDAATENTQNAEITAVEDALRNGIPHAVTISTGGLTISTGGLRVGGGSTLASLQVTGPSTFTGDVVFGGAVSITSFAAPVTLSSGATISTGVLRQNSLPAWSVYHSTHVALGANSTTGAVFDSQDYVRGSVEHSTASNSSRITLNTTGLYQITAQSYVHSNSNPQMVGRVVLNDGTTLLEMFPPVITTNDSNRTLLVTGQVHMTSTGYLTFQIVSGGGAVSTAGSSSPFRAMRFQGHFLG